METTNYRPAPILLHAYHCVNKAYHGSIALNTYTRDLKPSYQNSALRGPVNDTIRDLQIAYTNETLNTEIIQSIISQHLPDNLKPESPKRLYSNIFNISAPLNKANTAALKKTVELINAQHPETCDLLADNTVSIVTGNPRIFHNTFNMLSSLDAAIEAGQTCTDKRIKYIISSNSDERQTNQNARSQKRKQTRSNHELNKNRVISHNVQSLDEIGDVDLTPLAQHLLDRDKEEDFPFSTIDKHCYAKASRNDNGIPIIRIQLPIYLEQNKRKSNETREHVLKIIKNAAYRFNTDSTVTINSDFIESLALQSRNIDYYNNETLEKNAYSKQDIQQITPYDLYMTIADWLPISFPQLLDNIGANKEDESHRNYIRSILNEFRDDGLILPGTENIDHPAPFEQSGLKLAVQGRDHEGNVYATPQTWDEAIYGITPTLLLPEHMFEANTVPMYYDVLTVNLKHHLGTIEDIKITGIENYCELATNDNDVFSLGQEDESPENPITVKKIEIKSSASKDIIQSGQIYITDGTAISADGIITGVIHNHHDGSLIVKPSMEGISSFSIGVDANLKEGDIVTAQISLETRTFENIDAVHGNVFEEAGLSKLTAVEMGLPLAFPKDVLEGTPPLIVPPVSKNRIDFRHIPCGTIDPLMAKDFDDAIYSEPNKHGWKVMVFIADVSHYMKPGTKLYDEALKRGNSVYLPDLTIPMLPKEISNEICSLKPGVDRACLVTTMQINHDGIVTSKKFERGLMRSRFRLNYEQLQSAIQGNRDDTITDTMYDERILPALNVYEALSKAREKRGALNFNAPEQHVDFTDGEETITWEEQNEAHGIIEELMICSNVAAIKTLLEKKEKFIARVHGLPNEKSLKALTEEFTKLGIQMPPENIKIEQRVKQILDQAENSPHEDNIRRMMIRVQDRAKYRADLSEHFGLALSAYTHQTSPIRRMPDWYIHCLLNEACDLKEGSILTPEIKKQFSEITEHVSFTERRAKEADRKASLRLGAAWVERRLGQTFDAAVTHVNDKGMYVKVSNKNITSFIPKEDYSQSSANDTESNAFYKPGKSLKISPCEADSITGMIKFKLA